MTIRHFAMVLALAAAAMVPLAADATAQTGTAQNSIVLTTKDGPVTIRLRPDLAPLHVARIRSLTERGFYNGIVFHRVIDGFMAQTGDPTGTGTGGSDLPNLRAEFTPEPYKIGSLGMARASDPNSANSQFFICFEGCASLTGQYTLFGEVVSGMDNVRKIKKGDSAANGVVRGPDKIISMKLSN